METLPPGYVWKDHDQSHTIPEDASMPCCVTVDIHGIEDSDITQMIWWPGVARYSAEIKEFLEPVKEIEVKDTPLHYVLRFLEWLYPRPPTNLWKSESGHMRTTLLNEETRKTMKMNVPVLNPRELRKSVDFSLLGIATIFVIIGVFYPTFAAVATVLIVLDVLLTLFAFYVNRNEPKI